VRRKKTARQLTPRQIQLLKTAACFQARRCYSATIRELADELGISRSTAFEHIAALREKGLLSASPGRARSLKLTPEGSQLLESPRQPQQGEGSDGEGLALVGKVAAGVPIEAVENTEHFSLASEFGPADNGVFALEVSGDSMIDEDIRDGDYVICRHSSTAEDGQLVVAIMDDENATLKRFYKEPGRAKLVPANDKFQPIYSDNCRIEAVVLGLVRKFPRR